ncbi:MAG: hypothetical protein ACP5VP_11385, partial [Candidatus Limnocylindrales bacterium]
SAHNRPGQPEARWIRAYQPVIWSPGTGLRQLAELPQLIVSSPPSLGGGWLTADGGSPIEGSGTLFGLSLQGLPTTP